MLMVIVHLSIWGHLVGHQPSMNIFWIVLRYAVSSQDRGGAVAWLSPGAMRIVCGVAVPWRHADHQYCSPLSSLSFIFYGAKITKI